MGHNPDIPQLTNQISDDIPDIRENLEYHKDVFENFLTTWSDSVSTTLFPATFAFTSKSANYTGTGADSYICVDASGGARTITLPTAASVAGRMYAVKKTDSSINIVTVDGNGAETIDGAATYILKKQYDCVFLISNNVNWEVFSTGYESFLAAGRKLWIYENTAPTGWTLEAVTDGVIAVKGGTQAYNANGGTEAGSWTVSGITGGSHTHTGPSHVHWRDNHAHTGAAHTHQWFDVSATSGSYNSSGTAQTLTFHKSNNDGIAMWLEDEPSVQGGTGGGYIDAWQISADFYVKSGGAAATTDSGGGNSDAAGTGATGAGGTGASASTGNWRPAAKLGIIVSRD